MGKDLSERVSVLNASGPGVIGEVLIRRGAPTTSITEISSAFAEKRTIYHTIIKWLPYRLYSVVMISWLRERVVLVRGVWRLACAFEECPSGSIYIEPNKGCPRRGTNNDDVILLLLNAWNPFIYKTGLRLWFTTISGKQSRDC